MIVVSQEDKLRKEACASVEEVKRMTQIFNDNAENSIPRFDPDECTVGKELGVGGFSIVYEVKHINLFRGIHTDHSVARIDTAKRAQRGGQARYALKRLKNATIKKSSSTDSNLRYQFVTGVADLALEIKYLAVLDHPHIIKIRGVASGDFCSRDCFIILDRLYETLEERLSSWRASKRRLSGGLGIVTDSKGRKKERLFAERLQAAYSLSSAFEYLHSQRIVYRDLKPDNIGFDVRDDVKLFDFGLARELNHANDNDVQNIDLYEMTSAVGSLRYMSPEVAKGEKYNHKVDTYSFGLVLWQLCGLDIPYDDRTAEDFREFVFEKGYRPKVKKKASWYSEELNWLITNCWSADTAERPEFTKIREVLRDELFKVDSSISTSDLDFSSKTDKSAEGE